MRTISLLAIAAVAILVGVGGWVASTTHARVEAPIASGDMNLTQMTIDARDLPTEDFVDYTFVFN
jgi:hypothetical protein